MIYALLAAVSVISALGWLNQYVMTAALISWIHRKEIPFSADQLKEDLSYVWRKVLGIN